MSSSVPTTPVTGAAPAGAAAGSPGDALRPSIGEEVVPAEDAAPVAEIEAPAEVVEEAEEAQDAVTEAVEDVKEQAENAVEESRHCDGGTAKAYGVSPGGT